MNEATFAEVRHNLWIPHNAIAMWPGVPGTWELVEASKVGRKPVYLWASRDFEDVGDILTGGSSTGLRIIKEDCFERSIDDVLKGFTKEALEAVLSTKGDIKNFVESSL